jgi:hypothetical protein
MFIYIYFAAVWTIRRSESFLSYRDWNFDLSIVQPVASRYTNDTEYETATHFKLKRLVLASKSNGGRRVFTYTQTTV